jgi:Ni/Co efflux regulator RcnB
MFVSETRMKNVRMRSTGDAVLTMQGRQVMNMIEHCQAGGGEVEMTTRFVDGEYSRELKRKSQYEVADVTMRWLTPPPAGATRRMKRGN